MNSIDFPLIYCNGDSYSDENYHPSLKENTYGHVIANKIGGYALNHARSGSCNRRIIRTTVHDMIHQRQLNPDQKIIALIGLSFEIRSELWVEEPTTHFPSGESNFRTHEFSHQSNWRENLLKGIDIESFNRYRLNEKFFKFYSKGRAFFFNPYAERINLLCDLIMLRSLLESLGINFIVFQSPKADKLESDYLLDFFKKQLEEDSRFLDFENFGFCDWCWTQKFTPLDYHHRPEIAHYGPEAHRAFAEQILLPKLEDILK